MKITVKQIKEVLSQPISNFFLNAAQVVRKKKFMR